MRQSSHSNSSRRYPRDRYRADGRQDGTRKTIKELPESGKGGGWRVDVVGGSS